MAFGNNSNNMASSRKRTRPDDWEELAPSPVIHIRELPEHTLENDLVRAFERFGRIRDVAMIPNRGQALLEFEDQRSAEEVVSRASNDIVVAGRHVKLNFSTSKHIVQRTGPSSDGATSTENRILLLTVYNVAYPITVEVIHQIASKHGRVLRIVIFRKAHVQAMVEFESVEEARTAKRHLNGADIYSGCCTLKIEFARPTRLSVTRNDQDSWDYENPPGTTGNFPQTHQENSLLGRPDGGRYNMGYPDTPEQYGRQPEIPSYGRYENGAGSNRGYNYPGSIPSGAPPPANFPRQGGPPGQMGASSGMRPVGGGSSMAGSSMDMSHGHSGTPVLMIYNLDMEKFNCDRLFNLLCLYGNVVRVKFLRTKEGSAMAQMGDGLSVDRVIANLVGAVVFDQKLQIHASKQQVIMEVPMPYTLPDGSLSYKDFTSNRENRYATPEMASKNRVIPPSKTLHYWNCPPNFSQEDIRLLFETAGVKPPAQVLSFAGRERSSSGLLEWNSKSEASEALVLTNHTTIPYPEGRYPYLMKLSFSASPIKPDSGPRK